MTKIAAYFLKSLERFLRFLLAHLYSMFIELQEAQNGVDAKHMVRDVSSVLMSIGMLIVMQLIAFFVFVFLPQGKDVILIIAENIGVAHQASNLIWLLAGLFFWSIVSEYACRYAIYVTDHSGKNLTHQRVKWRKVLQQVISDFFLLSPYFIVITAFVINYFNDNALAGVEKNIGFGVPILLIYLMLNLVARFYFSKNRDIWRQNPTWFQSIMLVPEKEKKSCERLYGIYNDYIFTLRKPNNFIGPANKAAQNFADLYLSLSDEERDNFPQNSNDMESENMVPKEFQFKSFTDDPCKSGGYFRWIYRIPNTFYKTLHSQLTLIIVLSLIVFIIICFLPVNAYSGIGSPGLLVISFTCWTGFYIGVLFLDYGIFRSAVRETTLNKFYKNISIRAIAPILLLITSFLNNDHEVRYTYDTSTDNRPDLQSHFKRWVQNYTSKNMSNEYMKKVDSTLFYPVTFVCAEGGALRTGAFTALTLSYLQDSLARSNKIDFKNSIYAMSGVSGGSLGIGFFNAIAFLDNEYKGASYSSQTQAFFSNDFLAPVIGKMFYGDIINLFIPWRIQSFDRAIALEKAWEAGYNDVISSKQRNYFSQDYLSLYPDKHIYPALFINTTEVGTGRQCWLANTKTDNRVLLGKEKDIVSYRLSGSIRYSTMINFSTRFPLFSPGAAVIESDSRKYHFVDGGYYENTGTETILEIIEGLKPIIANYKTQNINIQPNVLVVRFSEDNGKHKSLNFGNEISEVLLGIYNTRQGRAEVAQKRLKKLVEKELGGAVATIQLSMNNSQVPMNWVLSKKSLKNINHDIQQKWSYRLDNDLKKLFFMRADVERIEK